MLVAAGLLALIGWQAFPWLSQKPQSQEAAQQQQPKTEPQAAAPAPQVPAAAGNPGPDQQKPSPMTPAEPPKEAPKTETAATEPAKQDTATQDAAKQEAAKHEAAKQEPRSRKPRNRGSLRRRLPKHRHASGSRPRPRRSLQEVSIISSPGAATATLDGRPDTACTTLLQPARPSRPAHGSDHHARLRHRAPRNLRGQRTHWRCRRWCCTRSAGA